MINIELSGCETATCGDISVTHRVSPIGKLARKLIDTGLNRGDIVSIYRDGTKCFNDATLGFWAGVTTIENDRTSIRRAAYVPFPQ